MRPLTSTTPAPGTPSSMTPDTRDQAVQPTGIAALDRVLPGGGLARGRLHEITAGPDGRSPHAAAALAAISGFAAGLLGRFTREGGLVLWCRRPARGFRPRLYGPGLTRLGLDPRRLVLVEPERAEDRFWTLEEALRSGALRAAALETEDLPRIVQRRLHLAARQGGVTGLILRHGQAQLPPGPMATRFHVIPGDMDPGHVGQKRVGPANGPGEGRTDERPILWSPVSWQITLAKCQGAPPAGPWTVAWPPR